MDKCKDIYTKTLNQFTNLLCKLDTIMLKMDKDFYKYLNDNYCDFKNIGLRFIFCLLLREFPVILSIRLLDIYISEEYPPHYYSIYLLATLFFKFSKYLKESKENIIKFLQEIPTNKWGEKDLLELVSEAYILKNIFIIE